MPLPGDLVLDAGAAFELLMRTAAGSAVREAVGPEPAVHVPEAFWPETQSAIRGRERGGTITSERASEAASDLRRFAATRWQHSPENLDRAWHLRHNFTTYDASYVALAEWLDATLITTDGRLAAAVREHTDVTVVTVI